MRRLPKSLILALVAAPFAAAGVWCVLQDNQGRLTAGSTPGKWTLDQTAAFSEYPVFYLGEEFEGLPLMGVIREIVDDNPDSPFPTERDGFIFIYGDCEVGESDGCAVPLDVSVTPRCYRPPELFPGYLSQGPSRTGLGGSEVQVLGEATYVWTGEVAVRIGGGGASHERAVEALRAINAPAVGSEVARLSPPNKSVCARIMGRDRDKVLSR